MSDFDAKELKAAVKALNDSGELEDKIKVVGVSNDDLLETFTEAVELLYEAEIDVPNEAIEFYNSVYAEDSAEEGEEEEEEEEKAPAKKKPAPKKKPAAKKKPAVKKKPEVKKKAPVKKKATLKKKDTKKPAAKKSTVKRDAFGFAVGSKAALFVKAISTKTGRTMAEIKKLDWNDKNATFYDIFNRLVEKDLVKKDEKTGKMTLK